jgi:hypothetical protein
MTRRAKDSHRCDACRMTAIRCIDCRAARAAAQRARRARYRAAGLCVMCGATAIAGQTLCKRHDAINTGASAEAHARRRADR